MLDEFWPSLEADILIKKCKLLLTHLLLTHLYTLYEASYGALHTFSYLMPFWPKQFFGVQSIFMYVV